MEKLLKLLKLLKDAHLEHEQENPIEDALATIFDLEQPNLGVFYTNFEILKEIEVPESPMNSKNISNILKKYGFENKRTNKGRGFIITRLGKSSLYPIRGLGNAA